MAKGRARSGVRAEGDDYALTEAGTHFSWRRTKADEVWKKRKIDLAEVASVFFDPHALPEPDEIYPRRGRYVGMSLRRRALVVVHAEVVDDAHVRVITSWVATSEERRRYDEAQRPKAAIQARRRGESEGDLARRRGRPTFIEFFRTHHPSYRPSLYELPPAGIRSRLSGPVARVQERGWSWVRAAGLPTQGERLAALRRLRKLTQTQLAERSRVPQPSISRVERGEEDLGARRAEALARVLGVRPSDLLWGRE